MAIDKPTARFIFGIMLIVCGWVICFNLFMLVFGIPFFLLGCILVIFSKRSWITKSLIIGVPIILWFVGFKLLLNIVERKEAVTVIVPYEFSGQARVVYGEAGGIEPERKDGRMILNIPANGILVIKPFLGSGLTDVQYYRISNKEVPQTAFGSFEGTMSSESTDADKPVKLDYIYDAFIIRKNDSIKAMSPNEEKIKDQLTDSLVKVSRGMK
jgi:hypothetical protein